MKTQTAHPKVELFLHEDVARWLAADMGVGHEVRTLLHPATKMPKFAIYNILDGTWLTSAYRRMETIEEGEEE